MALTEEQFDVWWKENGIESATFAEKSAARKGWKAAIAALPKPEAVEFDVMCDHCGGTGSDHVDNNYGCSACNMTGFLQKSLYTEAPIAQPASAPSEQKPVACCVCDGKGTITDTENCEWPCYQCAKSKVTNAAGEQNTVVLPFAIFDQEMADLRRFHECAMDDESYDVPKDRMKRLAEIGLVRRASGNYYEHTDFGLAVLNCYFDTAPQPDYKAQLDNLVESIRPLIKSRMGAEAIRESLQAAIASVKGAA